MLNPDRTARTPASAAARAAGRSQPARPASGSGRSQARLSSFENSALVLRNRGFVPCPEHTNHQARLPRGWQREHEEQLFLETWREKNFLSSGASASKSGPTRPRRAFRSSWNAPSATPIFSSPASANLTPASRTRYSARSSVETSSSGGGLGIHEPGSIISGGFFIAPARSGRAAEAATCPAAARCFSGRAA